MIHCCMSGMPLGVDFDVSDPVSGHADRVQMVFENLFRLCDPYCVPVVDAHNAVCV